MAAVRRRVLAGAVGLAAMACARAPEGRDALVAADRAIGSSLDTVLTDDAYYLAPDRPILEGREAIGRVLAESAKGPVERTPLIAAVSSDGSQGYTAGRVLEQAGGGPVHAKYLAYWRHEGGRWRVWAYVENPSPAAPDTAPLDAERVQAARSRSAAGDSVSPAPLLATDAEFSARSAAAGAGPAFGEFAEPAALLLLGGGHGMVWGDTAIAGFIGGVIPAADRLTWTPRSGGIAPGGDLGFTVGDAVYRHLPPAGGEQLSYTKYLTVWRRHPEGRWRYAADGGNAQPAPGGTGELKVEPARDGVRLVNPDTSEAFFIAFEQGMTALVNWRPCVDPAACRHVAARSERRLSFDSIPGYGPTADSAVVFWWRRRPQAGGWAFDSVRSITVGLRSAGS